MLSRAAQAVRASLDLLALPERECVMLALSRGLTHHELALKVGKPLGPVTGWRRRSLASLRPVLAGHQQPAAQPLGVKKFRRHLHFVKTFAKHP